MPRQSIPDSMRLPAFEAAGDMLAALESFLRDVDLRCGALGTNSNMAAVRDMSARGLNLHCDRMRDAIKAARTAGWRPTESA